MAVKYESCSMIENLALHFNGRIDTGENCLTMCSEGVPGVPGVPLCATGQETIEQFLQKRDLVIAESRRR